MSYRPGSLMEAHKQAEIERQRRAAGIHQEDFMPNFGPYPDHDKLQNSEPMFPGKVIMNASIGPQLTLFASKSFVADVMNEVFNECVKLREEGQKEYAGGDNAFGNFVRIAQDLEVTPEHVLYVYMKKHIDGIVAHIKGHKSQREDVRGRINDTIVYLTILRAMVETREPRTLSPQK